MFAWFSANLINIALVALLVLIVALLLRGMVRDSKRGKSCCGACSSCGGCSGCGKANAKGPSRVPGSPAR